MRRQMTRRHWLNIVLIVLALAIGAPHAALAGEVVPFRGYQPGTIVIVTHARELYYVTGPGQAIRYPVGVGKAGMAWHGRAKVEQKLIQPAWRAPPEIRRGYSPVIPGGSPRNPMGAAVLGLDHGNYAIHGTNNPASVGSFVSHGCIRMLNQDVMDLYRRVPRGTEVVVLQ
jgi:lipoprotein-anchoring transpeptidase ErfK/SrfK